MECEAQTQLDAEPDTDSKHPKQQRTGTRTRSRRLPTDVRESGPDKCPTNTRRPSRRTTAGEDVLSKVDTRLRSAVLEILELTDWGSKLQYIEEDQNHQGSEFGDVAMHLRYNYRFRRRWRAMLELLSTSLLLEHNTSDLATSDHEPRPLSQQSQPSASSESTNSVNEISSSFLTTNVSVPDSAPQSNFPSSFETANCEIPSEVSPKIPRPASRFGMYGAVAVGPEGLFLQPSAKMAKPRARPLPTSFPVKAFKSVRHIIGEDSFRPAAETVDVYDSEDEAEPCETFRFEEPTTTRHVAQVAAKLEASHENKNDEESPKRRNLRAAGASSDISRSPKAKALYPLNRSRRPSPGAALPNSSHTATTAFHNYLSPPRLPKCSPPPGESYHRLIASCSIKMKPVSIKAARDRQRVIFRQLTQRNEQLWQRAAIARQWNLIAEAKRKFQLSQRLRALAMKSSAKSRDLHDVDALADAKREAENLPMLTVEKVYAVLRVLRCEQIYAQNPWQLLGIEKPARNVLGSLTQTSPQFMEIKQKYRAAALQVHPDKNSHPLAAEAFRLVDNAWRDIKNQVASR